MELITDKDLQELKAFFGEGRVLPKEIQLGPGVKVIDVPKFVETHLAILKPGNSPTVQGPVLDRIMKLRDLLKGVDISR